MLIVQKYKCQKLDECMFSCVVWLAVSSKKFFIKGGYRLKESQNLLEQNKNVSALL